jgi:two-component system response regulator YesN
VRPLVVAEDEELFRRELAVAVPWEDYGFMLAGVAEDGASALELTLERRPAVLLTDVSMPGIDGLELVRRLGAALPEAERPLVVILTGHADFDWAREAVRLGAFDYLLKPVDDAELAASMRRASAALDERDRRLRLERAASGDPAIALLAEAASPIATGNPFADRVAEKVRDAYVSDLSLEDIAPGLGVTAGHLARVFRKATGRTFAEYLARYRVARAVELLRDPAARVGEVGDLVGYADARYFSEVFRRITGSTPTEFRAGRAVRRDPDWRGSDGDRGGT